jgi:WD40 repeat protein
VKKAFLIAVSVIIVGFLQAQTPRLVVPVGHTDEIASVSFSPDGKHVLTGSRDKTAKLWDISGREIATFAWHSNTISAVAFSPDGKFILTGSEDHTAGLWEISGSRIHTLRGHGSAVKAVAFSPDGQFLLTGSDDGTAKLWDFSGKEIKTFSDHPSGVLAVAFSADGKYILTGSGKSPTKSDQTTRFGIARLFDRESGLEIRAFSGHSAPVTVVAFSADGKYVVTGSLDASAKLYELETGREVRTFKSRAGIKAVSISPDGKYLLAASQETAQCWDLQSGNPVRSWEAHPDAVISSITFSPFHPDEQAGNNYILAGGERSAELLDWTGRTIRAYAGHSTAATALAFFAADGQKTLLMGCADGSAKRWNLAETGIQTLAEHDEAVIIAAFSVDGNSVLTAAADNTVKQWDENGRVTHSFAGTLEYPPAIALSPPGPGDPAGGKYILYGTRENGVEVWSRQPRKKIRTINRPVDQGRMFEARVDWEQLVSALAFSPADGGKFILIGDSQGNIEIRERNTGGIIKSIKGGAEADVGKDYFSTDAWQTMTFDEYVEAELKKLEGHTGIINAVAYSPDGKFFLSASADRTAKLWDAQYRLLHTFSHSAPVITTAFSPACPDDPAGGKFILTGSADNTVKLWHRASGELVHTFEGHTAIASAFSSDGKFVFTGSLDNTTKLWDIQSGQELATLISIGATDWVITNPSGLFDASPGAMRLMHYVVGLEVIELEQLKERYYEPGLLAKILGYNKEPLRSVEAFNAVALYPEMTMQLSDDKLKLQVTLKPRNGGIGKLSLFVNGKEVTEDANPQRAQSLSIDLTEFAQYYLPNEPNKLALRVYNEAGWLKSSALEIDYQPPATARGGGTGGTTSFSLNKKPSLYAVVVGTAELCRR